MKLRIAMASLLLALPVLASSADEQGSSPSMAGGPSVDLAELVTKVHRKTGKQFVLDPHVMTRVSTAGLDIDKVDYNLLLVILRYNDMLAFSTKDVVTIVPMRDARQLPTPILTADDPGIGDDTVITRLVQVRNACAAHMVPVLRPLMPQSAHMAAYGMTNTIILSDHADNVRRIVDLIERLDKAAPGKLNCGESPKSGS